MKKPLSLVIFLLSFICLQAEELAVYLKDGGIMSFSLDSKPVITIEKDSVIINSDKTIFSAQIDDVDYYNVIAVATRQEQMALNPTKPLICNGHIVFSQLGIGSEVRIYTIDGKNLKNYIANESGIVDVDLSKSPHGVYILKSPVTSIKVSIK